MRQQLCRRKLVTGRPRWLPASSGKRSASSLTLSISGASSGRAVVSITAAPLTAELTLPHSSLLETPMDAVSSTRERIGPSSSGTNGARVSPVALGLPSPESALNAVSGSDRRNGPPRPGTHRAPMVSIGSGYPSTAEPRAGAISRAHRPSWASDAATRNSMDAGGRPAAAARLDLTSSILRASASLELVSVLSARHGSRGRVPESWVSRAKNGPSAASPARSSSAEEGAQAGRVRGVTLRLAQAYGAVPRWPGRGPAAGRPSGRRPAR